MKLIFRDRQFSYELLRVIGHSSYGCADISECLSTAYRIKDGDFKSWHNEWRNTADRIYSIAKNCLKEGHSVSAREAFLRASSYYRTAEFFLHEIKDRESALATYRMSRKSFLEASVLLDPTIEQVEIPYENVHLKGYFSQASQGKGRRPVLIVNGGYDNTAEELFTTAVAAGRRGYNSLFFDGPGQGYALREQNLYFRPDWEKVITPVIDYLSGRKDIDPERIFIIGYSLGGILHQERPLLNRGSRPA